MKNYMTFLLFALLTMQAFSQNYVGNWIGEITIPTGPLDIAFKIVKDGDVYASTMDIPKQGLNGGKADATVVNDTLITITFSSFGLEYKGRLNDKDELIGNLYKGGFPVALNLKRGDIVLNRPQEPKAPFDYYTEEISFNTFDDLTLQGTLSLPKKDGKFPVVIIISGSGPQNRDGEMFGHKPYLVIADDLTKNGIGVLRFDERGAGQSEGTYETSTIDEQSSDITSAMDFLRTRKDIHHKKIGLLGHSIGGIIAPKVASESTNVNFMVLLAAPGINGDILMLSQKAALERAMGINEMQIEQGQTLVKEAYDIVVNSNLDNQKLKDSINSFYKNKYGNMFPESQRTALVNQITTKEILSLLRSKPSDYLKAVKCPVLALNGDKDFQVPSKDNLSAIQSSIESNGNQNVTTVELENLNHLFQESTTGMSNEYAEIEQTIAPKVLELISNWVKEHTK